MRSYHKFKTKDTSPEFYPEKQNIKEMKNIWGKEIIDPRSWN